MPKVSLIEIHCPECGYDLRGIPERQCPECGFGFERAAIEAWAQIWSEDAHESYHAAQRRAFLALLLVLPATPTRLWEQLGPPVAILAAACLVAASARTVRSLRLFERSLVLAVGLVIAFLILRTAERIAAVAALAATVATGAAWIALMAAPPAPAYLPEALTPPHKHWLSRARVTAWVVVGAATLASLLAWCYAVR